MKLLLVLCGVLIAFFGLFLLFVSIVWAGLCNIVSWLFKTFLSELPPINQLTLAIVAAIEMAGEALIQAFIDLAEECLQRCWYGESAR